MNIILTTPMKNKLILNVLFAITLFSFVVYAQEKKDALTPPAAKIIPKADTVFNDIRTDNYFWIRDKENPDVIEYLKSENTYTDVVMKSTEALQESLYNEMLSRIKETDVNVPYREGDYFYYTRTEKGKQYPFYCRKKNNLNAPEEIYLDQNELGKQYSYFRFGETTISPDGKFVAYSADTSGHENFILFVKNMNDGSLLNDRVDDVVSVVWAMDNATIFYSTRDSAWRPYRVFRHHLGSNVANDELLVEETDPLYSLDISRSESDEYIFASAGASDANEWMYLSAKNPEGKFSIIFPREHGHEYSVSHNGDNFYFLTNKNAKTFKLVAAPVSDPSEKNWREVIPSRTDVTLEGVDFFAHHFVAFEREKGVQKVRVTNFKTNATHYIAFAEPVYSVFQNVNRVFETNVYRFSYQSLVTPNSIYDYNLDTKEKTLLKQQEVIGGYDQTQYQSERIYATAADGKQIPISLVYKKGITINSNTPLHLYGYGSYGSVTYPTFSSNRLSLLNRGFIFAIAHIRGSGDMGREWYDDGKLLNKRNTFTDFISCAEYLIEKKYTSKEHLTIEGGSAGGLLMGAVTNMRPDLFKAVLAQVPFVDVMNTMLDASLPLTTGEYLEWGNPNEKIAYEYMKSYCPYTNVMPQLYPNLLVKVGLNDPRVGYWEGTKFAAKIRSMKTDINTVLVKINMGSGHGGSSGRYDRLKEVAFDYAYILMQQGIVP